jgi:hypothetical protein
MTGAPGSIGPQGLPGPIGPMPKHERKGLMFRFEKSPGQWGDWIVVPTGGGGGGRDDKLTDLQAQLVQVGNLIKQQGSNAGKVIGTNGTALEWVSSGGVTSVTASAPLASSGGATPNISLTGTVAAANGGTGIASYAVGDLLYASASTTLAKLGIGAPGQVLQAGATTPEWGMLSGNSTTIQLRHSSSPGSVPTALSLSAGEVVVNTADGKLYFKDSGGTVKVLSQADQIAPLTTKGDLLVNDGTSNVRLPVGTNTHVLTADSSVAAGVKWAAAGGGGGGVTSVTASAPIASSGGTTPNISLTGTVAIANGGTGQTTADNALNALLPTQSANNGRFLKTSGTNTSWADVPPFVVIQEFMSPGSSTWTKPPNAKFVHVIMYGGGGGGGSGRKRSSGGLASAASAGGGGGAGGRTELFVAANQLDATVTVTVGAGGTGGAAQTNNDTSGNNGLIGNNSSFGSFGLARGGTEGIGGLTTSGGAGFGGGSLGEFSNGSSTYSANGATGGISTGSSGSRGGYRPGGGASGGGFSGSSTTLREGGTGGLGGSLLNSSTTTTAGGGAGGNTSGAPNGVAGADASTFFIGGSGGGGGASGTSTAGNGGAGGYPGGGGGSGGAGHTVNSGAGGNGGNGYVRVVTFY